MRHLLAIPLASLLIAAGCGSGSSESGTTTASSTTESETESVDTDTSTATVYTNKEWSLVSSDPDKYKGSKAQILGRVFTVERSEEAVALQVWADPDNSEQNTLVYLEDPDFQVTDEDYVKVVGEIKGEVKGENAFGAELTLPSIEAESVQVVDATALAPEAIKVFSRNSVSREGVTLTVRKVEFADSETRVFVTLKNKTGADLALYGSSAKAVSGTRAVGATFSTRDYPELQSDLPAGSESSGVVVFPKMNPNAPLRLIFEGYSDDSSVGDYGSVKYQLAWNASGEAG